MKRWKEALVASLLGADECVRPYTNRVAPDAFVRGGAQKARQGDGGRLFRVVVVGDVFAD
jgi:hypothetical protein